MAIAMLLPPTTLPVNADVGDRTLYLYHTHTHETARITFKRNGVYDPKGLQELNWFLRDWRNNQPTTMAPQLFDLVWEVYQKVGATQPINIVSAYRSPVTNGMLHSRSSGVANNSQHMLGHAMDWFVPGVPLARLRQVAMQQQVGGVGFYPTSGSPFVHTDVGTVRAWPRMTEAQLQQTFPDGRTLHIPTDGHILSQTGYSYAQAQWNTCHAVPCTNAAALQGGAQAMGFTSMVALATTSMTGKTFADIHRGVDPGNHAVTNPGSYANSASDDGDDEVADADQTAGPAETSVATVAITAPIPMPRPAGLDPVTQTASIDDDQAATLVRAAAVPFDSLFPQAFPSAAQGLANTPVPLAPAPGPAPLPAQKSYDMMVATGELGSRGRPQDAVAAIASIEVPIPAPRTLLSRPGDELRGSMSLAYASTGTDTAAESQLETIIENETTGSIAMAPAGGTALTNSVGSPIGAEALKSYAADRRGSQGMPPALASLPPKSFATRDTALVTPGFSADLVQPVAMTSRSFAEFRVPTATDLDPATELGPMVVRLGFQPGHAPPLTVGRFAPVNPLLVASR